MLEPLRSRYLAALGVDIYVPRAILPGAKISSACEWDIEALESPVEIIPVIETPRSEPIAARAPVVDVEKKAPRQTPAQSAEVASVAVPKFALSIVLAAQGVLLIDEAPASAAMRGEYERLLGNFLTAVNKDGQFSLDIFFWPLRKSPQIAQDENAAKETLAAHLQKQIQQRALHTVLLLGDSAQRWVDIDASALRCIRSTSLLACLREPSLKRQLWSDVRGLTVR